MVEQDTPNNNVRVALSSEERIASMLLDTLEDFNKFFKIAQGIEDEQLDGGDFGGNVTNKIVIQRRASALIASLNSLKECIRISKPTLSTIIDITKPKNDVELLKAIRLDLNDLLARIKNAHKSPTLTDDLILEKEVGVQYSVRTYELTDNFTEVIDEIEELYEAVYEIILKNGLLTKLKSNVGNRRAKLNEL